MFGTCGWVLEEPKEEGDGLQMFGFKSRLGNNGQRHYNLDAKNLDAAVLVSRGLDVPLMYSKCPDS